MGEFWITAFEVIEPAAQHQFGLEDVIVETATEGAGQLLVIPARPFRRDLCGVGHFQVRRQGLLGVIGRVSIEQAHEAAVEGVYLRLINVHGGSGVVEDDLGGSPADYAGQAGCGGVVRFVFSTGIGEGFPALEHGIAVLPVGAITDFLSQVLGPILEICQREFGALFVLGQPGYWAGAAGGLFAFAQPESWGQGIPEAVEEAAGNPQLGLALNIARDHPGNSGFVLPEGALLVIRIVAVFEHNVAAAALRQQAPSADEVKRIEGSDDVTGEGHRLEMIGGIRRLWNRRSGLVHWAVGLLVQSREIRGTRPRGQDLIDDHFGLAGGEVGVLPEHEGLGGVFLAEDPIGPVDVLLQGEEGALTEVR